MFLSTLAGLAGLPVVGGDADVTGITHDSRRVELGHLYVAIPGATVDGARFITDAVARGASAVCASAPAAGVPTVLAADPRAAMAALAAAFHGWPSRELTLVGITGSLGKTSTSLLAQAALHASFGHVGVIGSLGIRFDDEVVQTGMTTPEAPAIHGALRRMVEDGASLAVMEVTSHSILLHRVEGLEFALGALTNIVPDEHLEFHPTPEHYIATKARFFDMLRPGAPLIVNVDDPIASEMTTGLPRPIVGITLRDDPRAVLAVSGVRMDARGSAFTLRIRRPLARLSGEPLAPGELPLALPILGRQQVANAAVAAAVALVAGARPDALAASLARAEPMRRRMQIIHRGPLVLDDTVGNPESIDAVFDAIRGIARHRLRVVYAIRGSRDTTINERNAAALAEALATQPATLIVTASEDVADARNRVTGEERDAALAALAAAGTPYDFVPALGAAVERLLAGCTPDDLVLLLGAQGMDEGARLALERLRRAVSGPAVSPGVRR